MVQQCWCLTWELQKGSGVSEAEIRERYKAYKDKMLNQKIVSFADKYGIATADLEAFFVETVKLRRLDEDALRDLLSHIENWKLRKVAKEELLARLAPLFAMMTNGGTIEGLNAYVK